MATHSSVLAWRIPGTGEPGGLPDVYGVAQSQTRLKRLSSSSNRMVYCITQWYSIFISSPGCPEAGIEAVGTSQGTPL